MTATLESKNHEQATNDPGHAKASVIGRRMIRLVPTESMGERFPAMHLVRSHWFTRFLSKVMFYMLSGLVLAAIFLPWQQTSKCEGEVVARLPQLRRQVVESSAKGIINYIKPELREGSLVTQGEVIMELSTFSKDQLELTRQQERALLGKLEISTRILENSRAQVLTEKENIQRMLESADADVKSAHAKWKQAEAEIEAQKRNYDQAKRDLEVAEKLKGDAVAMIDYQRALNKEGSEEQKLIKSHEAEDEAFQNKVSKERMLDSKRKEAETKIIELDQKVAKAQSDIQTSEKELQELRVKLGELERLKIVSPSSGRIQAILGQVGTNTVKEGDKLFEVIPDTTDLAVELNVSGLDLPLLSIGDSVRLQFDGWPAIQFVGWPSVAVGTFGGKIIAINPSDDLKGNFKIIVGPDPNDPQQETWPDSRYLRQGVRARAWVILKTVPLGFEIWRQLNGFPASKADPDEEKSKSPKLPKFK